MTSQCVEKGETEKTLSKSLCGKNHQEKNPQMFPIEKTLTLFWGLWKNPESPKIGRGFFPQGFFLRIFSTEPFCEGFCPGFGETTSSGQLQTRLMHL